MKTIGFILGLIINILLTILIGWFPIRTNKKLQESVLEDIESYKFFSDEKIIYGINVFVPKLSSGKSFVAACGGGMCNLKTGDIFVNLETVPVEMLETIVQHEAGHQKYQAGKVEGNFDSVWGMIWRELQADWNVSKYNKLKMYNYLINYGKDLKVSDKINYYTLNLFRLPVLLLGYLIK